jgi:inorganic pyrophosphatase/exopolyphosphatase
MGRMIHFETKFSLREKKIRYLRMGRMIPVPIAKLMMSAILSDTLNLKSPTTTKADQFAVCLLSKTIN